MGNHLSKPVCIDFFGLPGCGKSTLSHLTSQKLRCEGLDVKEVSYDMDHGNSSLLRSLKKSFSTIWLFLCYPCLFWRVSKALSLNGISLLSKLYFKHIINLSYKICALKGYHEIILFDEGFCQAVLSISVNNERIHENCYESLVSAIASDRRMIRVYVKTDADIALTRIRMRNDGQSRLDNLSDKDVIIKMRKMEAFCRALPQTLVVDNNNAVFFNDLVDMVAAGIRKEIDC